MAQERGQDLARRVRDGGVTNGRQTEASRTIYKLDAAAVRNRAWRLVFKNSYAEIH